MSKETTITDRDGDLLHIGEQGPDVHVLVTHASGEAVGEQLGLLLNHGGAREAALTILSITDPEIQLALRPPAGIPITDAPDTTPAAIFGDLRKARDARADDIVEDERQGWNLDALNAAAQYDREAVFSYQKPDDPIRRRTIRVNDVYTAGNGVDLVTGWDLDQDEPRVFRLDRIVGYVSIR